MSVCLGGPQVFVLSEEVSRLKEDKAALETAIVDLSGRVREGETKQVRASMPAASLKKPTTDVKEADH